MLRSEITPTVTNSGCRLRTLKVAGEGPPASYNFGLMSMQKRSGHFNVHAKGCLLIQAV